MPAMRLLNTNPLNGLSLAGGEGCLVWDTEGRRYVDMMAGTWCAILGHAHPRWVAGVGEHARALVHTGASFDSADMCSVLAALKGILPEELDRLVLLSSGSEAVELAIKMARAATGADTIVSFERGYYGATTYALALSDPGRHTTCLPWIEGVRRLPAPECRCCAAGRSWPCGDSPDQERAVHYPCLGDLARLVENGAPIAAVIYEPVFAGGMLVPPAGWQAWLRKLTSDAEALLVADEVTTGLGRTGRWFGFEHEGIVPDIVVMGKALGAGLPVAAVATKEVVESAARGPMGRHVQSHQNDPFSCRLASTVISILEDERLVERAAERGAELLARLERLRSRVPAIADVRGLGLMAGVELREEHAAAGPEVVRRLLRGGFVTDFHVPTATFRLFPPFVISSAEIERFAGALEDAILGASSGSQSEASGSANRGMQGIEARAGRRPHNLVDVVKPSEPSPSGPSLAARATARHVEKKRVVAVAGGPPTRELAIEVRNMRHEECPSSTRCEANMISIEETQRILSSTPGVLKGMYGALDDRLVNLNEGDGTWSPFQILCHFVHNEAEDWLPRIRLVLAAGKTKVFRPFDPQEGLRRHDGRTVTSLLEELAWLRQLNLAGLRDLHIGEDEMSREGMHPRFGPVTIEQLLGAWVCHDLTHIHQIARVVAHQFRDSAGPFAAFMSVLSANGVGSRLVFTRRFVTES
jgi:4-aminobutyrate aminotransferase-like enzyme